MRHKKNGRKLNRTSAHRKALNRNLARSLILHGRVRTTLPKAKEVVPFASRLVTLAKDGSLSARRRAIELMGESEAVGRLFSEIAPRFSERPGGYLRIVRLPLGRLGDRAPQAFVEFVEEEVGSPGLQPGGKKKRKKLSRKAKRELAKKERKKHDIEKKRAEAAKAEAEEAAEEAEETEEEAEETEEETREEEAKEAEAAAEPEAPEEKTEQTEEPETSEKSEESEA